MLDNMLMMNRDQSFIFVLGGIGGHTMPWLPESCFPFKDCCWDLLKPEIVQPLESPLSFQLGLMSFKCHGSGSGLCMGWQISWGSKAHFKIKFCIFSKVFEWALLGVIILVIGLSAVERCLEGYDGGNNPNGEIQNNEMMSCCCTKNQ